MSKKGKAKTVTLAPVSALAEVRIEQDGVRTRLDPNGPTVERLAKEADVTIKQRASGLTRVVLGKTARRLVGADGLVRLNPEQLDRLHGRGTLSEDKYRNVQLFEAGDRLRQHWYRGTLGDSLRSVDLNGTGGGGNGHPAWLTPTSESVAYHRAKFRAVRERMDRDHFSIVYAVVCGDSTLEAAGRDAGYQQKNAAGAVALDRLRRGLEWLAIVWGLLPPRPANDQVLDSVARSGLVVRGDDVDAIIDRMMVANAAQELSLAV